MGFATLYPSYGLMCLLKLDEVTLSFKITMLLKIKKAVGVGAAIVLVVAWFSYGILENSYVSYPQFPKPSEGRTVPHAVKGIVVYITREQRDALSWLAWIEIGSGMVAVLVILIRRGDPFRTRK